MNDELKTTDWLFNEVEIKAIYRLIEHSWIERESE